MRKLFLSSFFHQSVKCAAKASLAADAAKAITILIPQRCLIGVLMTMLAMCLGARLGACRFVASVSYATLQVFFIGYRLQMIWIDAAAHTAQMIQNQTIWNWTPEHFIRDLMGRSWNPATIVNNNAQPSITVCVKITGPQPAAGIRLWRNKTFKSFEWIRLGFSHLILLKSCGQGCFAASHSNAACFYFTPSEAVV